MRILALLLASLVAAPLAGAAVNLPPVPLPAPLHGPYALVCPLKGPMERCNTRLTVETGPANEVMVAGNPRNPLEFLAVAKDYDHADPGSTSCVGTSFYHTLDGGATWREGYVADPGPPCESDPVAAFDREGVAWISTLRISPRELANYRPDGAGWKDIGRAPGFDKQWIASNPDTGTLYLLDATARFQRSTDGGLTWSTSATGVSGFGVQIAAAPDGRVVVTALRSGSMVSYVSTNDGLSFQGPFTVSPVSFPGGNLGGLGILTGRMFRTPPTHGLAVDQGTGATGGRFWAAFPGVVPGQDPLGAATGRLGIAAWDVWLSHSDDGIAWSAPVRANDDPAPAAHFFPTVAVSDDGVAHVAWMDQRVDPSGVLIDIYYANTAGSGLLGSNVRVTDQPFASLLSFHQSGAVFVGDYMGIAATEDRAVVTWPDTRMGRAEVFAAVLEAP